MILLLCANPHVQKKLQAELDAELKDGKEPSIEDKEKLSYTCKFNYTKKMKCHILYHVRIIKIAC